MEFNLGAALRNPGQIQYEDDWERGRKEVIESLKSLGKDMPYLVISLDPAGAWMQGDTDTPNLFVAIGMICEVLYRHGALPAPTYRYRNIMDDLMREEKS